ncbi:unnamed protein product, partial [Arabidopsis halleri]
MLLTCIVWLKLVSYAHTSYDIRSLANAADKANPEVSYYVTLKSLAYFMVAPTLCYQVIAKCINHSYTWKSFLSKPRVFSF